MGKLILLTPPVGNEATTFKSAWVNIYTYCSLNSIVKHWTSTLKVEDLFPMDVSIKT